MSIETGPPPQPPQMSPDHKWIWDGSQWRPVAQHEALFPTWRSVGAGLTPEAAAAPAAPRIPTPLPAARFVAPTAPVYVAPAPEPAEVPLWQRDSLPSGGHPTILYFVVGAMIMVVLAVILNSFAVLPFPWQHGTPVPAKAKVLPPLTVRSDSARADRFVNGVLAAPLGDTTDTIGLARQTCAAGLTTSCEEVLIDAHNKITILLRSIEGESVPVCISGLTTKLRSDLTKTDDGTQAALKAFNDNRPAELQSGVGQINAAYAQVLADSAGLSAAVKSTCDTQPTGP